MDTQSTIDASITSITGPLHDVAGVRLHRAIRDRVRDGQRLHILDLRELPELDSHTLSVLIRVRRLVREVGGSVSLIVDQPHYLRILSITGLDRLFGVFPSQAAALASLGIADVVPA